MSEKPLLRGYFHQAMFFISLGACLPLILTGPNSSAKIGFIVYSLGLLTMFGVSALYHRVTWQPGTRALMKKFDHAGIYIMIAGTFTPVALMGLEASSAKNLLITIWSVALVGIIQSIFFVNLPKMVSASIYLVAGYLILPYLPELNVGIGRVNVGLIIAGGIIYSVGAFAYGFKRPILAPKVFGYHEVFHLLVAIAAIVHFIVVYSLITNQPLGYLC